MCGSAPVFCTYTSLFEKYVVPSIRKYGNALTKELEELWRIFLSAAQDGSTEEVICIFDALDECKNPGRDKLIKEVAQIYNSTMGQSMSGSKLKFFLTSRPYDDIEQRFRRHVTDVPIIRLAGENESTQISEEISTVICAQVAAIGKELDLTQEIESSLHQRLSEIPHRTYLWLHLTLDEIRNALGRTEKKLLRVIDQLPETIEQAYEKILTRCSNQKDAKKLLQIVVAARRPLTLSEIDIALEIQVSSTSYEDLDLEGEERRKKWIRQACGLFVSIIDNRVMLIHETAMKFLVRQRDETINPQRWRHSIDLQQSNLMFSEVCISYLLFQELEMTDNTSSPNQQEDWVVLERKAERDALLEYSAEFWADHVRNGCLKDVYWLRKAAKLCDIGDGSRMVWAQGSSRVRSKRLDSPSRIYVQSRVRSKRLDSPSRTSAPSALFWAVILEMPEVVRFITEQDDSEVKISEDVTEAVASSENGEKMITLLLERRSDEVRITGTVVMAAVRNEYGEKMMALLLEQRGDEITITEDILEAAATGRNGERMMALLLKRRSDEVIITEKVVMAAAKNQYAWEVVTPLLKLQECNIRIKAASDANAYDDILLLLWCYLRDSVPVQGFLKPRMLLSDRQLYWPTAESILPTAKELLESLSLPDFQWVTPTLAIFHSHLHNWTYLHLKGSSSLKQL